MEVYKAIKINKIVHGRT